jgi:mercuric ion transport protein
MMQAQSKTSVVTSRSWVMSYFSLFTSLGTLVCCALPSLLVLLGLGATVASMLSFMPWLVTLSRHKAWVFAVSGLLIMLSFAHMYMIAPRLKPNAQICAPDDLACARASRVGKLVLWIAAVVYVIGFSTAYLLGPILARMDQS